MGNPIRVVSYLKLETVRSWLLWTPRTLASLHGASLMLVCGKLRTAQPVVAAVGGGWWDQLDAESGGHRATGDRVRKGRSCDSLARQLRRWGFRMTLSVG